MKPRATLLTGIFSILIAAACKEDKFVGPTVLPETTKSIPGQAAIKVLHCPGGWLTIEETLQPQYLITMPKRELTWRNVAFSRISGYTSPAEWSLIDAVVHPSGQVTAASVQINPTGDYLIRIKLLRFRVGGSTIEFDLAPIPLPAPGDFFFPGSLDRVRLKAFGEDVYVVARWAYNDVQAHKLSFDGNKFQSKWSELVEPPAYIGTLGIIGGGFDNFHQGDNSFFVYADVDSNGDLFVAVPSTEDVLASHDDFFNENLMSGADPSNYDFGVAILTKFTTDGGRAFSRLQGHSSRYKSFLNMRVTDGRVFLTGRVKTGMEPNSWDAWISAADSGHGNELFDRNIDFRDGDMFWDVCPIPGGQLLVVGSTGYTQNPGGMSVSDARSAFALVLNEEGEYLKEISMPQGPADRGSEAISVLSAGSDMAVFAGVHNAPGTHASVYSDGFLAIRSLAVDR